ncbi:hypothetical protein QBC32DRAFT_218923, partial [Pseudoneurospora amorphoporcata]
NPLERMKSANDANESNAEARSSGDFTGDDGTSPTPTSVSTSLEPQQTSRSAKILPSIEVSHHQGYSEGNTPPLEDMNDTIEGDLNRNSSAYSEPTILERDASSTSPTQSSRGSSNEDDIRNSPLPHSASSPSPSPTQY